MERERESVKKSSLSLISSLWLLGVIITNGNKEVISIHTVCMCEILLSCQQTGKFCRCLDSSGTFNRAIGLADWPFGSKSKVNFFIPRNPLANLDPPSAQKHGGSTTPMSLITSRRELLNLKLTTYVECESLFMLLFACRC